MGKGEMILTLSPSFGLDADSVYFASLGFSKTFKTSPQAKRHKLSLLFTSLTIFNILTIFTSLIIFSSLTTGELGVTGESSETGESGEPIKTGETGETVGIITHQGHICKVSIC